MKEAAEAQEFEEAARYRNRLMAVRHLSERQVADRRSLGSADVARRSPASGDTANVQLFHLRDGRLADRHGFYLENVAESERRRTSCGASRSSTTAARSAIPPPGGRAARRSRTPSCSRTFLGERRGANVEVRAAQRGEKRRMAELAERNADARARARRARAERTRARRVEALEELREALNLEMLPVRIECFDISNLGETNPVASMVVFEDAVAKKSDYRKFGIRHGGGPGRLRAMREAVGRRFARMTGGRGRRLRPQLRRRSRTWW